MIAASGQQGHAVLRLHATAARQRDAVPAARLDRVTGNAARVRALDADAGIGQIQPAIAHHFRARGAPRLGADAAAGGRDHGCLSHHEQAAGQIVMRQDG